MNSHLFLPILAPLETSQNLLSTNDISYFDLEDDESQILSSRSASFVRTPTPQPKRKLTFLSNFGCSGDQGFVWVRLGRVGSTIVWIGFGSGF